MKLIDGDKLYDALADKLSWLMGYDDGDIYLAVGACIRDEIESQPERAERMKWIPCSEKLPENAMNIIAQFSSGTVTELRYAGNGIFEGIYEYSTKVIIAWMPLPEPYKGEGKDAE